MNSAPLPTGGDATAAANGTVAGAAPADALPLDPAQLAASGVPAAMPFLQFMDLNSAAMPAGELPATELAADDEAMPEAADGGAPAPAPAAEPTPAPGNDTLLGAMAMPLMPSMMMAMPAALPAALRAMSGKPEHKLAVDGAAAPAAAAGAATATSANSDTGVAAMMAATGTAAAAPAAGIELPPAAGTRNAPDASLPALAIDSAAVQPARASLASAPPAQAQAASQPAAAVQAGARDAVAESQPSPAAGTHAGFGVAPAATTAPARDGGTLALSGPPTAWRQSLQEALGERLNLQLTKNAEQATIRLEPPMLGRVEISIRHVGGSLEVNITATHSEVLRQLNTVSDNLRSELAGRQYTDVSVNVSQAAPRAQASAQAGAGFGAGADSQGRGRQQAEDGDERTPGAALAEAHHSTTAFSLSGRA